MQLPRHVAIIMDGNGRWASERGLPRIAGHKAGMESIQAVIKKSLESSIEVLTLFAFSIENWQRPKEEVDYLLGSLFTIFLDKEVNKLHQNGIQVKFIGDMSRLDEQLWQKILTAEALTADNDRLKLVIALSYSGRWDIAQAVRKLGIKIAKREMVPEEINEATIDQYTNLSGVPEPDLLIRTSGEKRVSNFILWQLAYTELYFSDILWPDFREREFLQAIAEYKLRNRRFGKC